LIFPFERGFGFLLVEIKSLSNLFYQNPCFPSCTWRILWSW